MRLEYKHVRFDYGLLAALDRRTFDERLTAVLNEHGTAGWELKGCFAEGALHTHLVFCRPVKEDEKGQT
jgi:hypothetical protein